MSDKSLASHIGPPPWRHHSLMTKDARKSQRQTPSPLRGEGKGEGHRTLARVLRANQTDAERRLWNLVRARQINNYYHTLGEGVFEEFPPPMIDTGSKNYLTIALEEVAEGKIKHEYKR